MKFVYNKQNINGSPVSRRSSPRDLQNRYKYNTSDNDLYKDLLDKIEKLNTKLINIKIKNKKEILSNSTYYSEEEFNSKLEELLLKESKSIEDKFILKLKLKEEKIIFLEELLKEKDGIIKVLSTKTNTQHDISVNESDDKRPVMEADVIDPSEQISLESHIKLEKKVDVNNMKNKLSKLKTILG